MVASLRARRVVLVEGHSDRGAVAALARRLGRDLAAEGVEIVAMGGATNVAGFVRRYGPAGLDVDLFGMCDAREAVHFERAFDDAGLPGRNAGFFVCDSDLEDELIRTLGIDAMLDFVERQDELRSFRIMQRQPAQRERTVHQQLHRFIGAKSGRKLRYGELLIDELDLASIPAPLAALMAAI